MARRTLPSPLQTTPQALKACAAAVQSALLLGLATGALALAVPGLASAQTAAAAPQRSYSIAPGTLDQVLNRFASAAGAELAVDSSLTRGKTSTGLNGSFGVQEGFAELLRGQGLQVVRGGNGAYSLRAAPQQATPAATGATLGAVTVTAAANRTGDLPAPYAGGQVARGGRLGLLGDKDFRDTPFNVTSYTAQTIEDQQVRSLTELVENNPSFRPIFPDNDTTNDFAVRGNKVKALDTSFAGLYGMASAGVESLERVEIITGANALLNGLGPIGGVGGGINQVPKRAGDVPLTRLTTSYVSGSQLGVHADIGRRFGTDNQYGVRFNGVYSDGDTAVDRQGRKLTAASLALDYRGDGVRLSADFGFRTNDVRSPSRTTYVLAGVAIPPPPPSGRSWQNGWSYDNTRTQTSVFRGEVDISPDITAYAAAGSSRFEEALLFANSFMTASNGNVTQRQVYWPLYRKSTTAEAGVRGKLTTGAVKHSWTVATSGLWIKNGITINNLALTNTNIYNPVFISQPSIAGLPSPGNVPQTGNTVLTGVAFADTVSTLDERWQLTLGLRQQNITSDTYNAVTGALVPPSYKKSATTPGLGLVFKASEKLSLYANYIEGLQQGPIAPAGTANPPNQTLEPYVSRQHEAGLKFDHGSFATTLSAYQLVTPNAFTNPATNVFGVNGEQRTRGIELNTFGEITRGVRLLGGLALVDAKQTKTLNGTNNGKQVTGAPKTQFNLGGEWDLPALQGLTLSGRAVHTSSQYLDVANLQAIPSWTRLDAGARYKTRWNGTPTTIRFNIQNLANKSYWLSAIDGYLVQSTPRTFLLSATFDF